MSEEFPPLLDKKPDIGGPGVPGHVHVADDIGDGTDIGGLHNELHDLDSHTDVTIDRVVGGGSLAVVQAATSCETSADDTFTFDLPAGLTNGNLLILYVALSFVGATCTEPAGWTELKDQDGPSALHTYIACREVDGTEGATVNVVVSGPNGYGSAIVYEISGAADPAVSSPELSTFVDATAANTQPNPDIITPSWGASGWVIACASIYDNVTVSTWPTGYATSQQEKNDGIQTTAMTAIKAVTSTTENPPAFTISSSEWWAAGSIAIRGSDASASPRDDEVLAWDFATDEWINQNAAEAGLSTVANLGDLTDVDLTGLADNDVLRYDLATTTWKPEVA